MATWQRALYLSTKKNASKREIDFQLEFEHLTELLDLSNGRCMLTGLEFDHSPANGKRRAFAASLDRIDSSKGYSRQNCRVVCCAVNLAMNEWGIDVLRQIAHALVDNEYDRQVRGITRDEWTRAPRVKLLSSNEYLERRGVIFDKRAKFALAQRANNICTRMRIEVDYIANTARYPKEVLDRAFDEIRASRNDRALVRAA